MAHGVTEYFLELERFARRASFITATVALILLATQLVLLLPRVRASVRRAIPEEMRRWGFEGPDQYVRRILLQSSGQGGPTRAPAVSWVPRQAMKGGSEATRRARTLYAIPDPRRPGIGPGESSEDLLTRAREIYRSAPVVQSTDLVIDRLVKPTYPEAAREKNIEGRVALVAQVDTLGQVVNVDIISGSGELMLDRAAQSAVYQCRFRPYRVHGELREVYAVFRFAFRIY